MVRSLYAGISGLRNHQVAMDVAGNNIANVNTVGFKSGRVTFEESMSQMLQGSSRPAGNSGGTNPLQVGLGMAVGSIDTLITQGNLQSTGQITDIALEGRAYFAYSNGTGTFYSRNGGLQLDAHGRLVSPTNGFILQGMMAQPDGSYPGTSKVGDLRIPFGEKAPAKATTEIKFACNLDSDSEGLGTVTHTNRYLQVGAAASTLSSLYDQDGNDLGIQEGDILTMSMTGAPDFRLPVTSTMNLQDLADNLNNFLQNNGAPFAVVNVQNGTVVVNNGLSPSAINGLQIRSSRPGSNSYVANAFAFPPSIAAAASTSSTGIRTSATAASLLSQVFDANGQSLGLENGDVLTINGSVGNNTMPPTRLNYTAASTLQDLVNGIQAAFNLPTTDGTVANNPSVSVNAANTDDDMLPDGSIVVRGQPEKAFSVSNISITATNSNNTPPNPIRFNANNAFTEIQGARDTGTQSSSIVAYDQSGDAHTLTTTFTHSGRPGEWLWQVSTNGGEQIISGKSGHITFGQDGSPSSFTFDDNATAFRFDPMNGSNIVSINLNVGSPGSFQGATQFRAPSTTAAREQNGYPMGKLQEINIDEKGEINGVYTNGISKGIARIYVAEFNNPAGMIKVGDSMYTVSNNSGEAVMLRPGVGSTTVVKPGSLEMSNVELATEFTNMITTQRGFQANARVITTSDQMLQELVQLIR